MSDIASKLMQSIKEGCFLKTVYTLSVENPDDTLTQEIIELHNKNLIDVVSEFNALTQNMMKDTHFWFTRNILEKVLPRLNASVQLVMACIKKLTKEAGAELAPTMLYQPFIEYCAADYSRANSALEIIEKSPSEWIDFLDLCLLAGARSDFVRFHQNALRLSEHTNIEIRKRAMFSLGQFVYSTDDCDLRNKTLTRLADSVNTETDEELLSTIILAIFNLYINHKSLESRVIEIVGKTLEKCKGIGILSAATILHRGSEKISLELLKLLFTNLLRVKEFDNQTLLMIDLGISRFKDKLFLITSFQFIECLLLSTNLTINSFPNTISSCKDNMPIFNLITTKWLLSGEFKLCSALRDILFSVGYCERVILLEADPEVIIGRDEIQLILLARKSIGFLFHKPITVANFIISLFNYATPKTAKILSTFLFDPLLMSYPGQVNAYLKERIKTITGKDKTLIKSSLVQFKKYMNGINQGGNLPEIWPAESWIEAHRRHTNKIISNEYRKARQQSPLFSSIKQTVILYGKRSINYIYSLDGSTKRTEIPMTSHHHTQEISRLSYLDTMGLNYTLYVYRIEKLKS